jgi:N-methylhydantoinase B/oxoprolinase/acetone carboxylase alpha subunit
MQLVILANRRVIPPYGKHGGEPGALGRNWIERVDGSVIELAGTASVEVVSGDCFVLETPGGGGYGAEVETA